MPATRPAAAVICRRRTADGFWDEGQQSNVIALLGADTLPDVSTALRTIWVGPAARQYVIVDPYPITPSSLRTPFKNWFPRPGRPPT